MDQFDSAIREIYENYYYEEDVETVLEKLKNYKRFIIFGAGRLGHQVYDILAKRGAEAALFCDNRLCGETDADTGLKVISPAELKRNKEEVFVLLAIFDEVACRAVYRQLLEFGFADDHLMNVRNMAWREPVSFLTKNLDKYKRVYSLLEDDFSKKTYVNMIKKQYLDVDISGIVCAGQEAYFDKELVLTEEEVFVDCGGYTGDTSLQFIEKTKGRYKKLVIFEPEEYKENIIRETLKGYAYELFTYGVWSSSTVLKFSARGDSTSHVAESGEIQIPVKALDDVLLEEHPTFIKMDIEGAETESLKGSRKIIERYRPKLAICIYHKPEDLFEIPILLREMRNDYRLLIRQYSDTRFETVCYAI
jgi:FkbM family methyltransferase